MKGRALILNQSRSDLRVASAGSVGLPPALPASHILTVAQAAKVLGKSPMTLRRWIAAGAPCFELGEVGRGHSSRVDLDALQHWLANRAAPGLTETAQAAQLDSLAESLWRVLKNDEAAAKVGISARQAAGLLILTYERLAKDLTHRPVDIEDLPAQMQRLCSIRLG